MKAAAGWLQPRAVSIALAVIVFWLALKGGTYAITAAAVPSSDRWTVAKPSPDYVLLEDLHSGERLEVRFH